MATHTPVNLSLALAAVVALARGKPGPARAADGAAVGRAGTGER